MVPRKALTALLAAALGATALVGARQTGDRPPYRPAESMRTFELEPGFRIELVASEPDIQSPVAMDIDEDGRIFIVEMPGYPLDVRPTGTIKLLEDTDGDGRVDRTSVFADGLVLPHGVMRWKKGVLVAAAPDILYFEDTDGDRRADVRRVLLTGFAFSNPQHTVNSPLFGLDNWIYLAHQGAAGATIYRDLFGDRGKPLTFPDRPDVAPVPPRDRSVRFRPDEARVEVLAGESQFGHTFDAYGRYFGNDNSHHLWHEALTARYVERNPHLPVRSVMRDIPEHGAAAKVYPITRRPNFELLTEAGEFTSASAPTAYVGGAALPPEFNTSIFVAEPVHNLVHRDVVVQDGSQFTAKRAAPSREFLAAGDAWFRPVNLYVGPDGALYVIDYYRARIEHPEWTSSAAHRDPSTLYAGQDRGRLYRVTHDRGAPPPAAPRLGGASDDTLVAALSHDAAWWRRTAQRLIVQDRRRTAVPLLRRSLHSASPLGVLHALWTLDGLDALQPSDLEAGFASADPGVRENAVRLSERWLRSDAAIAARVVGLAADSDPRVRFQVLASLGDLDSPDARRAHERLLFANLDDEWMVIAGLSAGSDRAAGLFERVRTDPAVRHPAFVRQLAGVIGARQQPDEIAAITNAVLQGGERDGAEWRQAALEGLAAGVRGRLGNARALDASRPQLLRLAGGDEAGMRAAALGLLRQAGAGSGPEWEQAVRRAVGTANDGSADPARRADAIALVALDDAGGRTAWLQGFVAPREPEPVQLAAVQALGRVDGAARQGASAGGSDAPRRPSSESIGAFLLERWPQMTPPVRSAAADVLLDDEARSWQLVRALEKGIVQPWTLDFWQKRDLLMNRNPGIRAASRALLEENPEQRAETFRRYAAALDLSGDAARGGQVFARACAACHKLGDEGSADLGPDLATVRHRPPLLLLGDILMPSQAIAQRYETYVVERKDGRTEVGVLAAQTPTSITLRQGPGAEVTIDRREIRTLSASPQSSMPADLHKAITPEEMADLLAFMRKG